MALLYSESASGIELRAREAVHRAQDSQLTGALKDVFLDTEVPHRNMKCTLQNGFVKVMPALYLRRFDSFDAARLTSGGGNRCYRMPLRGGPEAAPLFPGTGRLHSISYASRMLGLSFDSPTDGTDAYVVPLAEDGTPAGKPILVARGGLATSSRPQCPRTERSWRISRWSRAVARCTSRASPIWNRDGSRLFYMSADRVFSAALRSVSERRFDAPQAVTGPAAPSELVGFDVAPDGASVLVGREADPLMLRRDIRLWPGWGKTLPPVD